MLAACGLRFRWRQFFDAAILGSPLHVRPGTRHCPLHARARRAGTAGVDRSPTAAEAAATMEMGGPVLPAADAIVRLPRVRPPCGDPRLSRRRQLACTRGIR